MTVLAICRHCQNEHALGDRIASTDHGTTKCPACGALAYNSQPMTDPDRAPEADRIRNAVADVPRVGEKTIAELQSTFGLFVELEAAGKDELTAVEGVGPKTAELITEAVAGS